MKPASPNTVEDIADFMHARKLCLTTAESCTAGLIAATLADIPGAGALLDCAFVAYSVEAKQYGLGVQATTLERFNLTSEEVAREMAIGALQNSRTNLAISNTGVTDDTDDRIAPGTQCFAWVFKSTPSKPLRIYSETRRFEGTRNNIRQAAALYALTRIPFHFSRQ